MRLRLRTRLGERRFDASRMPWLCSDAAGIALAVLTAAGLQLSAALAAGTPVTLSLVLGILLTAAGASDLFYPLAVVAFRLL